MRAKEFIASLIMAAQQQSGQGVTINIGTVNIDSEQEDDTETALDTERFVPPLQQKIELMKKSTGQKSKDPSIYSNDDDLLDD